LTQLVQLFQNLIGNAIKYRRAEAAPQVTVTARTSATEHEFTVQDNGIGIDSQYFERVFGVFQRLHTREEYPGTGIGLAICRKIVERHRGRIWIESTLGSGTAFHFTLPV
jgi:light-regulated signal transduction histidine kinase (bacteriophytochrome)